MELSHAHSGEATELTAPVHRLVVGAHVVNMHLVTAIHVIAANAEAVAAIRVALVDTLVHLVGPCGAKVVWRHLDVRVGIKHPITLELFDIGCSLCRFRMHLVPLVDEYGAKGDVADHEHYHVA